MKFSQAFFAVAVFGLAAGFADAWLNPATPVACGERQTVVWAHDGKGVEAMVREAAAKEGVDPNGLTNLITAAQQAAQHLDQGAPVTVCFEHGGQRVATINGVTMTD